jgi:NADH-ubiquinone oxidoreductase chain 5
MPILIIIFPLLSFIYNFLFGRFFGKEGSYIITLSLMSLCSLTSIYFFFTLGIQHKISYIVLFPWIKTTMFQVDWEFIFDSLSLTMLFIISIISTLVHFYSTDYMKNDPNVIKFLSFLSLFTVFMMLLVTANNFLQLFFGWEGVGLCSFLLINFWSSRVQANKAAIKAMVVNKIGDIGLAIAIIYIFLTTGAFEFSIVFNILPTVLQLLILNNKEILFDIITLGLIIGVVGKSAQIGLHTWLPDAMEGPTPVSALLHAATMVTAGVFLVLRCSFIFELNSFGLTLLTIFGGLTCFMAASTGIFQNDLKKVIAYSTCSQLGYMIFACGISQYHVAMFHLFNHAFFKALLFLTAGVIIHALADEQDMRKMGGLQKALPFSYAMFVIGSLALTGFPFLTGFYSKDVILETAYSSYTLKGHFVFWLGTFAAFCTAFYSMRLLILTFLIKTNNFKSIFYHAEDASNIMIFVLSILCLCSIFFGYFFKDLMIGFGTSFWNSNLAINPLNISIDEEFLPTSIKLLPTILSISALILAYEYYILIDPFRSSLEYNKFFLNFYYFFNKKWLFDRVYNNLLVEKGYYHTFFGTYVSFDRGLLEKIGPQFFETNYKTISNFIIYFQKNRIPYYFALSVFSLFIFITLWFINNYFNFSKEIFSLFLVIFSLGIILEIFFENKNFKNNS